MYKIVKTVRLSESNKVIRTYGIKNEKQKFKDISINKDEVKRLCELCNQLKLDNIHFKDVIEDFLDERSCGNPSEKDP